MADETTDPNLHDETDEGAAKVNPPVKRVPAPSYDDKSILNAAAKNPYPTNNKIAEQDDATLEGRYMSNGYAFDLQTVTPERYKVSDDEFAEAKAKLLSLKALVAAGLKKYGAERKSARRWAFIFTMFSTVLAGIVTVLLGWRLFETNAQIINYLSNIALVFSAGITVMGVMSKFWDAHQLWVRYTDTENALKELMGYIEYTEQGVEVVKALHLVDVEALNLKYHLILQATNRLVHDVRSQN